MRLKFIGLAILAGIVYSCASKSNVASTPPTPPKPPKTAVALTPETEPAPATLMTPEIAAGKVGYENNCAKCHRLFDPKEYAKEDWAPILVRMQKKAQLSNAEMAPIVNYIYTQL